MRYSFLASVVLLAVAGACSDGSKSGGCIPDSTFCEGDTVRKCSADGNSSELVQICDESCSGGQCVSFDNGDVAGDGWDGDNWTRLDSGPDVSTSCQPGKLYCMESDVYVCGEDGASMELVAQCPGGCDKGKCVEVEDIVEQEIDVGSDVPVCQDECTKDEFHCSGIKMLHLCLEGPKGCLVFDEGTPCDDGNPCTDDACAVDKGCVTADNKEQCDDGNPCTAGDHCENGECAPGANICQCLTDKDCADKEDGDQCNGTLECMEKECIVDPDTVVVCPELDDPCLVSECEKLTGKCKQVPSPGQGLQCDDGNACTVGDTCSDGKCVPGGNLSCVDGKECTSDSCNPASGCAFFPLNGMECASDGNPCTVDVCQGETCAHPSAANGVACGAGMVCQDGNCVQQGCNPACGECQTCQAGMCQNKGNGLGCSDDGNLCTEDQCLNGSCNHPAKPDGTPCGGGMECQSGSCGQSAQPVQLAGNLASPWDLAIDSNAVYFVENSTSGTVKKVTKSGAPVETLATGLVEPCAITTDGSFAYWIERNNGSNGTVKRVPVNGGAVNLVASGLTNAQNTIVVYQGNLYFGDGKPGGGGTIKKVSTSGGNVAILVENNGLLNLNTAVDADNGWVYFHNDYDKILRVPANGGQVQELGSGAANSIDVWGNDIFFTEYSAGAIRKMPVTGGSSTWLASGNSVTGVTTDGQYVYWTEFNSPGKVARVSINGGTVKTYSSEANSIGLAVDDGFVYYTVSVYTNKGRIMKAPK